MAGKYTTCPQCGGRKPQLLACLDCGYTYLKKKTRSSCQKRRLKTIRKLPDYDQLNRGNDVFDRGMVVSGGGVGVGKGKKK